MKEYDPEKACKILKCAFSYLNNADRLIYSYGSRTFLSGYDLYDASHEMRGNIDCSTFVILALSGVPYEESPYAKGSGSGIHITPSEWAESGLADFNDLPDRFIDIAERIGRPYLSGPKGLDLKKAEELGIDVQTLISEVRASGAVRRSVSIASHYRDKGACFSDPDRIRPGDLAFFGSSGFFTEEDRMYPVKQEISHVGIITEDTSMMINSSGVREAGRSADALPAVSVVPLFGKRAPVLFARTAVRD